MQNRFLVIATITVIFFSCKNQQDKNTFTVSGTVKNFTADKVYLDHIIFNNQAPITIDSASIDKNKFTISAKANEEGLYRIRFKDQRSGFMFINDINTIDFTVDSTDLSLNGPVFNTPANISLKKFIASMGDLNKSLTANAANQLYEGKRDSATNVTIDNINSNKEKIAAFCFKYGDTAKSPVLSIFATTAAPVEIKEFEIPLEKITLRFPKHEGAADLLAFVKQKIAESQQTQGSNNIEKIVIGNMAPEITMPDTEGKSFSLSMLRGKYVLIDFWASWCGPCRAENPNVVAAYNQFKDKNFTVLGVSLDKNKASWLEAIEQDNLTWKHISDLQYWSSAAVSLYGIEGIPFNALIDPEGKIIATDLRGEYLSKKLREVLK